MLTILTAKDEVTDAQRALRERLQAAAAKTEPLPIGFQGGSMTADVSFYPSLNFWFGYKPIEHEGRHWNAFGYLTPSGRLDAPTIEVNPPFEGTDRRVQGAFARDDEGVVYLVHRGRPGGGRAGVSKAAFLEWYAGARADAEDANGVAEVLVVGAIDSDDILLAVERFTGDVADFKEQATSGIPTSEGTGEAPNDPAPPSPPTYSDEFFGARRSYTTKERIQAVVRHGVVVRHLHLELVARGERTARDRERDLFIPMSGSTMRVLFEVKTDSTTTSVYTAVGQLLVHGGAGRAAALAAVMPSDAEHWAKRLAELGIRSVFYDWKGDRPVFTGIAEALKL